MIADRRSDRNNGRQTTISSHGIIRCMQRMLLYLIALSCAFLAISAHANPTESNKLPGPPSAPKADDLKNFRLRPFIAKDSDGKPLTGIPANLVDVHSGMGNWDAVKQERVRPFIPSIPPELRDQIQLFYADNDIGWMMVPRDWKLWDAALGADGTSWFTFVAPTGPKDGWMAMGEVPGCFGCMYMDADGLIPAAHQILVDGGLADPGTEAAKLVPTPDSLSNPNPCTAVLHYHQPRSPAVRAIFYVGAPDPEADATERSIYLALPDPKAKLADLIMGYSRTQIPDCGKQ